MFLRNELKDYGFEEELEGSFKTELYPVRNDTYALRGNRNEETKIVKELPDGKYYVTNGDQKISYYKNKKLHRDDDKPAEIYKRGVLIYRFSGKGHRNNGPACIGKDFHLWVFNGNFIENELMDKWLSDNNIPLDWNLWSENNKRIFYNYWSGEFGTP